MSKEVFKAKPDPHEQVSRLKILNATYSGESKGRQRKGLEGGLS